MADYSTAKSQLVTSLHDAANQQPVHARRIIFQSQDLLTDAFFSCLLFYLQRCIVFGIVYLFICLSWDSVIKVCTKLGKIQICWPIWPITHWPTVSSDRCWPAWPITHGLLTHCQLCSLLTHSKHESSRWALAGAVRLSVSWRAEHSAVQTYCRREIARHSTSYWKSPCCQ